MHVFILLKIEVNIWFIKNRLPGVVGAFVVVDVTGANVVSKKTEQLNHWKFIHGASN